ncbi:MAG: DUF2096 family protein [Candidatus Bathyarchaeia archaeon]
MVNYEALWRALADLVTELRKSGESIPPYVMKDLRSAKTTIQILKVDKDNPDHVMRIEEFLRSVEAYVMYAAQKRFGSQTVDEWMERLKRAREKTPGAAYPPVRFVPGVPRDKHWLRIKVSPDIPLRRIEAAAEEMDLGHEARENGYVIVYGEKDNIRNFVRRMAELSRD